MCVCCRFVDTTQGGGERALLRRNVKGKDYGVCIDVVI